MLGLLKGGLFAQFNIHPTATVVNNSSNKTEKYFDYHRYALYDVDRGAIMANPKGRPPEPYETIQIRIDTGSAELLRKLAGISGKSLPAWGNDELVPMLREMLRAKLKAESQELGKG